MNYIRNGSNPETFLTLGGVLSEADVQAGYIGIIGAMIGPAEDLHFQDLVVTKAQLEHLRTQIDHFLKYKEKYPD